MAALAGAAQTLENRLQTMVEGPLAGALAHKKGDMVRCWARCRGPCGSKLKCSGSAPTIHEPISTYLNDTLGSPYVIVSDSLPPLPPLPPIHGRVWFTIPVPLIAFASNGGLQEQLFGWQH